VSEVTEVTGVSETPKFQPRDLITFQGYRQGAIAWLQYGTAVGAVYFIVAPLFAGMLPDLRWSLGVVSTALLIRGLLGIVTSPFTGWLVARIGIRPVVMIGGLTTAAFTALTATVHNPVEFGVVFGVALTIADGFMGFIPATTVVHNWFMSRRGVVMGFVNSGAGFGGLVFAPLMAVLVNAFGWRHALLVLALIIFVLAIPSIWLKTEPKDVGQWVDGVAGRVIPPQEHADAIGTLQAGVRRMVRSPLYWMIFLIFGLESWALGVYAADQVLYLKTIGVGSIASSGALGAAAGIAACSGIVFSRLSDRSSPYYVLIFSTTLMALGSVCFLFARSTAMLWIYSALFGAGYGLTVPTIPVALSRYFGALDFSKAFGMGQILTSLFGGLGPWVTGQIVDHTGSFTIPIYLITGLLVLSMLVAIAARPSARFFARGAEVAGAVPVGSAADKLLAPEA
jgi:MFS family permease